MTEVNYDMIGNIIRPGDLVVAPALRHRSAELRVGVVSELKNKSGYCQIIRLCQSKNYKGEMLNTTKRKHQCYCSELIVIRWDSIKEDSVFYKPLNEVKKKVMMGK